MGSRKAVFLLQTDPWVPKPVLRALREAESLKRADWDVSFVSWIKDASSPTGAETAFPTKRVHSPVPTLGTSFVRRALAYMRVSSRLRDAALRDSPDLIVAHDFEVLSAAVSAGRRKGVPIIYDSHEDWPELIAENSPWEAQIARVQERRLCRAVAHVLTVSDPIAAKFRERGTPTTVLYNARPSSEVVLAGRDASRSGFGYAPGDFVVGFAGAFGAGRGLDVLLEALSTLPTPVKGLLVGGPEEEARRLRARAETLGLQNRVRVYGYQSFGELSAFYASMDLGAILLDRRPNHERALPNKLFDYMAHGVPVLVPAYPAMSAVVRDSSGGTRIDSVDVEHVTTALHEWSNRRSELIALGIRGREAYLARYCWERQQATFLGIIDGLPGSRR